MLLAPPNSPTDFTDVDTHGDGMNRIGRTMRNNSTTKHWRGIF
jgi:hypothetical protein